MDYDDEDMRLLTTKVKGMNEHFGFSTLLTGRTDGLNSKGLCVTMAGGGAWEAKLETKRAFNYAFAIRTLLDRCSSTTQAIDVPSLINFIIKSCTFIASGTYEIGNINFLRSIGLSNNCW